MFSVKKIMQGIVLFGLANSAFAQHNCSTVNIIGGDHSGKNVVPVIIGHNGKTYAIKKKQYRSVAKGKYDYVLEGGMHSITLAIWDKRQYLKKARSRNDSTLNAGQAFAPLMHKTVGLNLVANRHYELALGTDSQGEISLSVVKNATAKCNSSRKNLLHSYQKIDFDALEESIKRKLIALAKNVMENDQVDANISSVHIAPFFGSSIEQSDKGLEVKHVVGGSTAHRLGLQVGDIFADYADESVYQEFIASLDVGQKVQIAVERGGKEKQLKGFYLPSIAPEFLYKVNNADQAKNSRLIAKHDLPADRSLSRDMWLLEATGAMIDTGMQGDLYVSIPVDNTKTIDLSIALSTIETINSVIGLDEAMAESHKKFIDHLQITEKQMRLSEMNAIRRSGGSSQNN